jgi:hypothetical protein
LKFDSEFERKKLFHNLRLALMSTSVSYLIVQDLFCSFRKANT